MASIDNRFHLQIDSCGGFLSAGKAHTAVKILILHRGKSHHTVFIAHTVHGDHFPRQIGGAFNIVCGAGGHGMEDHLFGAAAGEKDADLGENIVLAHEEFLLLGELHGISQSALRVGDDGDFGYRLGVLLQGGNKSVAHFMVCDKPLFLLGEDGSLLFGASDDCLEGNQQIVLVYGVPPHTDRPEGSLVHQIRQIRADAAGGGLSDSAQIHVLGETDVAGMHLEGGQPAGQIRPVNGNAAVETAGPQQSLVQHLGPVGGCQHDNSLGGVKAIQLS
ncbi:hypothetical protein SDC9_147538 [bioreactor metagenome]|uniref:Uncharacterized protein n=1 Tax=bioreactor metagenome TaxID=1076179 RepID=A0A645EHW6_9ZZZZ